MHRRCFPCVFVALLIAFGALLTGCEKESWSSPDAQVQALQLGTELDRTKKKLEATEKASSAKDDALLLAKEETEKAAKVVAEREKTIAEKDAQIHALEGQLADVPKREAFVYSEISKLVQQGLTISALDHYKKFVTEFPKSPLVADANRAIAALTVTAPRDVAARVAIIDPRAAERELLKKFTDGDATPQDLAPLLRKKSKAEVVRLLGAPNATYREGSELGYVDKVIDSSTGERGTLVIAFEENQVSTLRIGYLGRPIKP